MIKISYSTPDQLEQIKEVLKYHEYRSRYYQFVENAVIYWPRDDCTQGLENLLLDTIDGIFITTIPSCALRFGTEDNWWMTPTPKFTKSEIEFTTQFQNQYNASNSVIFIADENIKAAAFLAQCTFPYVEITLEHPKPIEQ